MDLALLFSSFTARLDGRKITQQRRLYEALRDAILEGLLPAATRLPATRALAKELGIARNSAMFAYEQLAEEGFLDVSRQGSVVARVGAASSLKSTEHKPASARLSRRVDGFRREPPTRETPISFRPGLPALDEFPMRPWRAAIARAWRSLDAADLGYARSAGLPDLRHALVDYLKVSRGVRCDVGQVFITDGTQTSLDLCARMLADAGDRVWIEEPGYIGARAAFQGADLTLLPIPVDADGIAPSPMDWATSPPRLIYVTPSHQYPLGSVLSIERRMDMIERAREHGAWIIEDDYDSEFRHTGSPFAAMQGLAADTPVVYLGTFSKTMFPALRIGFMVVPSALSSEFAHALGEISRQGRVADQLALADFMRSGAYTRHLRRMRALYAQRRVALISALQRHFGEAVTISGDAGGMHLTVRLNVPLVDVDVCDAARSAGLWVAPVSTFCLARGRAARYNGLLLGYAGMAAAHADEAVGKLAQIVRSMLKPTAKPPKTSAKV
ncbi:PLP-dependent aminotransferase family protein [Caballeronia mineralivorans]|jgi:GntR family transcriptional regulator/MocR family aminotransferase|uniref:MocR-like pyridoxine biosynthesis transcription factor PdxR n=1 Tax=Caballeronia mineralivorans TaxID=2010198 RepID=UPI0023EFF9BB|nr:PLP-dependent aminotransferase family protein [Caballeronia mineralivorans]MDB5782115.1 DNA-binding protein [Caballeronia mineralivorans]MEA3099177.1 GntR family transcriptional regulator / MocR family aminotransferase [Caballeronia mineralivorans]